ncbi:MAG: hypothetical protein AAB289_00510 [Chloroflexota bacterium]
MYLLFLGTYLSTAMGHFWSIDHVAPFLAAQSLAEGKGLAIKRILNAAEGVGGLYYTEYGVGLSVAAIPFYLVGKFVDTVAPVAVRRFFAGPNMTDWGGTVPHYFVSLFSQFMTPITCILVLLFCIKLGFTWRSSFLTTLLFGLATGAWVGARDFFQQTLEGLLLLASVYVLVGHRDRLTSRHAWIAGGLFGFGILVRLNLVIALPAVVVYLVSIVWLSRKRSDARAAHPEADDGRVRALARQARHVGAMMTHFMVPVLLGVAGDRLVRYLKFAGTSSGSGTLETSNFAPQVYLLDGLFGNLLTPGGSIFAYSPPIVLGVFLWVRFFRAHRAEALLFVGLSVTYLLFFSSWSFWHGQWTFGPRYLWPVLPFMVIPCAFAFGNKWLTLAAGALGVAGFVVQLLGVTINPGLVHLDYVNMKVEPQLFTPGFRLDYFYNPDISPISMHFRDFMAGRHIDLWLNWVLRQFGFEAFLVGAIVPVAAFFTGVRLIRSGAPTAAVNRQRAKPAYGSSS